jgi:hypothetical protein
LLNVISRTQAAALTGGEAIMKWLETTVSVALITGSLTGGALAADGVLLKKEYTPGSYCHMKFPAIEESTLGTNHPQLKSSDTGDVIDFYGPCDENPTGKDQVVAQKLEERHHWRNYLSRG